MVNTKQASSPDEKDQEECRPGTKKLCKITMEANVHYMDPTPIYLSFHNLLDVQTPRCVHRIQDYECPY